MPGVVEEKIRTREEKINTREEIDAKIKSLESTLQNDPDNTDIKSEIDALNKRIIDEELLDEDLYSGGKGRFRKNKKSKKSKKSKKRKTTRRKTRKH